MEGRVEMRVDRAADLRSSGGSAGALRYLHEQFHREHLDGPGHAAATQESDEDVIDYPPRKLQFDVYTGPISISSFQKFQWLREELKKDGVNITLPSRN